MGEQPRLRGVVKWFNATKGFGFITPEAGSGTQEDLFVHQTNINSEGFRSLREGETVEFEVETSPDGRQKAVNISGPGGAAPQGAPPRTYRTAGAGPYPGRGGGGRGSPGRGGRGGFYGYPVMPPYYAMGYYFPPGDFDPTAGRGRGRGRGGRAPPPQYYGMPGMAQQGQAVTEPSGLQVVVHNLPWTCQWQQLKDIFKEWRVDRADIVYDSWGRSRGFGTVRFFSKADAESACNKMNNTQVEGRTISVRIDRFA